MKMDAKTYFDAKNKLWKGEDTPPLYNPQVSIGQILLKNFTIFGPKVAQISDDTGVHVTYNEMKSKTIRVAQNLQRLGYKPGQMFTFVARNTDNLAPVIFASFCIGCPVNTLEPSFGKVELLHMLETIKPDLLFCDLDVHDLVSECLKELNNNASIYTFGGETGNSKKVETLFEETGEEKNFSHVQVNGVNDIAAIICSSGTTGLPKGVSMSHATLINACDISPLAMNDILFCFSTLYWLSGVLTLLFGSLYGATRIITTKKFTPDLLLYLIETYKITYLLNPPQQVVLTLKSDSIKNADLSSVKYYYVGGSTIPTNLPANMKNYLPNGKILPVYGMSEVTRISITTPENGRDGTVGQLRKRVIVKILDKNGNRCGINVNGEICVKPYFKFIGYYGNEMATKELHDPEGFIHTADVGHFDNDGFLYFVDRKKDFLRYYGFHISPSEIEVFLIKSPKIKSVCVVGIPDKFDFDLPAAVIVRNNGSNLNKKDVSDMVSGHFADFQKLRGGVYFVDSLPLTPSGKILRREVKRIAIEMHKNEQPLKLI